MLYKLDKKTLKVIPITCEEFKDLHPEIWDIESRIVSRTEFKKFTVSTVFLPVDLNFGGQIPQHFETALLGDEETEIMARYATWSEAVAGHWKIVIKLRKGGYKLTKEEEEKFVK
jgi:hypothetical protein